MEGGIVEGVAGHGDALVGAIAVAEARGIVVGPGNGAAEFLHRPYIGDEFLIRHAVVVFGKEPGQLVVAALEVVGCAEAVEAVDDQHGLGLGLTVETHREDF